MSAVAACCPGFPMPSRRQRFALSLLFLTLGGLVVLAACGLGPMGDAPANAPRWIVALGGAVFCCGGVLLLGPPRVLGQLMAATVTVAMTVSCAWVALYADASGFSGTSVPFLSREANVVVARGLFGLVALLGLAILCHALWRGLARSLR